ncbi:hypothetical protein Mapa_012761 [Marchantia paleacea]|nr:hypothetical protein Mapa_012761 [Marchantia paleacea]
MLIALTASSQIVLCFSDSTERYSESEMLAVFKASVPECSHCYLPGPPPSSSSRSTSLLFASQSCITDTTAFSFTT